MVFQGFGVIYQVGWKAVFCSFLCVGTRTSSGFNSLLKKKRGHLKTLSVLQGPLSLSFFGRLQMYTAEGTHVRSVKQVVLAHRYKRSGKMHMGDQCSCVFFWF